MYSMKILLTLISFDILSTPKVPFVMFRTWNVSTVLHPEIKNKEFDWLLA